MFDYYMNTESQEDATKALTEVGIMVDGEITPSANIDIIGEWVEVGGVGVDGEATYTTLPGFHFNVRSGVEIVWPAYVTQNSPKTPWRVWG